ncbi:hypothetical protein L6164_018059 [Bauhinia variegata]|uniref:Uncharacterized protein n=1 Tax=Bauhinia variegata TaxID=167791 RepID=A0ACB9N9T8_BAUVA|nr:hypothetical protein L6164_018059 [Bauhinia variegata]
MEAKGGEVRRLHIIYFLSRMGRIEQPHLIRLHHQARTGVYLRDVKRWLGELRGTDMPDAFAWSYKRKYKNGYVWQDLLDDDLITPISDNEYVLKGSQIIPPQFVLDYAETESLGENKASILAEEKSPKVKVAENKHQQQSSLQEKAPKQRHPDWSSDTSRQSTSEISHDSLVFSSGGSKLTFGFDFSKVEEDKLLGTGKQNPDEQSQEKFENYSLPSLYHNLMSKKSRKQSNKYSSNKDAAPDSSFSSSSSSSQSSFTKSKSYSSMFRNLITCGTVDTNDAVLLMMNGMQKNVLNKSDSKREHNGKVDNPEETTRTFGTSWIYHLQQQQYSARKSIDGEKASNWNKKKQSQSANHHVYKPFGGPICSQCGKSFKPEKLHKHMKSCKGMKHLAKPAATSPENIQHQRSSTSSYTDSACSYLLTN